MAPLVLVINSESEYLMFSCNVKNIGPNYITSVKISIPENRSLYILRYMYYARVDIPISISHEPALESSLKINLLLVSFLAICFCWLIYTLLAHFQSYYPLRSELPETSLTKPSIETTKHLKAIGVL